jgi:hypothetical protein
MILKSENQVCSFELSQELEKLGVKQNSIFYWRKYSLCKNTDLYYIPNKETDLLILSGKLEYNYSAFTVAELGEILPVGVDITKVWDRPKLLVNKFWEIKFEGIDYIFEDKNIVNAMAKMLIYLLENNLIKL